jgi:integrase
MFSCDRPKKNGVLHYCRQKTMNRRDDGAEMFVKIHPCIKEIMKEYSDAHRCFDYYLRYADKDVFTTALNQGLKLWQTKEKVESFTFYSARHSWATIARSKRCDIDAKIVTAGLCHVDAENKVDDIYIKFDWEQLWDAQEKILNVFNWQ